MENPTLIDDLKLENKNNKLTPGAKDSWYTNAYLLPSGNPAFSFTSQLNVIYIMHLLIKIFKFFIKKHKIAIFYIF